MGKKVGYFNISNLLSLSRAPLAFLFLPKVTVLRFLVVVLAGLSDYLDGFLARRLRLASPVGAVLDPLMDKLFVFFIVGVLVTEMQLGPWSALAMVSRDLLLGAFGVYLAFTGSWDALQCRAIWWGKAITLLQYAVLVAVIVSLPLPIAVFAIFPLMSLLFLGELFLHYRRSRRFDHVQ